MRMKKPAVVLATAALMTLAACGGGSGSGTASSGNSSLGAGGNAGSFKNPDAKAPAEVPSDASDGGTLTVLTNQVPSTLDPTQAYYVDSTAILLFDQRHLLALANLAAIDLAHGDSPHVVAVLHRIVTGGACLFDGHAHAAGLGVRVDGARDGPVVGFHIVAKGETDDHLALVVRQMSVHLRSGWVAPLGLK